jgi:hypothetical protein
MRASSTSSRSSRWRAADDLADARRQHVHRRHGLLVVVEPHVERLDLLGIVHDTTGPPTAPRTGSARARTAGRAPLTGNSKSALGRASQGRWPPCSHALEVGLDEPLQALDDALLDALAKNAMSSARSSSTALKMYFRKASARSRRRRGRRTRSPARPSRTRRGAGWCCCSPRGRSGRRCRPSLSAQAVGLDVELARHGGRPRLPKKSWRSRRSPSVRARQVDHVEGGDAEHLARALGSRWR